MCHGLWKKHLPNTLSATSPVLLYTFFFPSSLPSNVPPPEQTNSCATTSLFLSFTSLQVFQLWSHSVDILLDKARAGSPAPTSNPCLSSHFLDERFVLASFWPLLSHLLLCSALPLAFPQPCSESFLCTSQHSPVHFLSCIFFICSLLAFLNPFHHSTHAFFSPPRRCRGLRGQMSCSMSS